MLRLNLDNLSAVELEGIVETLNKLTEAVNQLQTHLSTNLVFRNAFKMYVKDNFPMFVPDHVLLVMGHFNTRMSGIAIQLRQEVSRRNNEDMEEIRNAERSNF